MLLVLSGYLWIPPQVQGRFWYVHGSSSDGLLVWAIGLLAKPSEVSPNWASRVGLAFLKTDPNIFFANFCIRNSDLSNLVRLNFILLEILERTQEQKQNRLHSLAINAVSSQTKSIRLFWFCSIVLVTMARLRD